MPFLMFIELLDICKYQVWKYGFVFAQVNNVTCIVLEKLSSIA